MTAWLRMSVGTAISPRSGGLGRTVLTAVGVLVGVVLTLMALTVVPALSARDHRAAWQFTQAAPEEPADAAVATGLVWLPHADQYASRDIIVIQVAAAGPEHPMVPGVSVLPGPGELLLSPALEALIGQLPADQLGERFPGTVVGTVGPEGLSYPEQYVAIVGGTAEGLRAAGAGTIQSLDTSHPGIMDSGSLRVILVVAAIGLLTPVVIFVGAAAGVSAARREERFAALRLVGATRTQVAIMAGAETAVAAIAGALIGWAGYALLRPIVAATVTFDGVHFMPDDVQAPLMGQLAVLIAVPLVCTIAAIADVHRAGLSPVAARQRIRRRPPRAWRLIPLSLGVAGLVIMGTTDVTDASRVGTTIVQLTLGTTFLALLVGLVLAGPLICSYAARGMSRLARRLPGLLAARRIAADPYTFFRATSGVAIAALVATMFAGSAAAIVANVDHPQAGALRADAVEILLNGAPATALAQALDADPDARTVVTVREGTAPGHVGVACAELALAVELSCPEPPPRAGRVPPGLSGVTALDTADPSQPVRALYVTTEGGLAASERIRTLAAVNASGALVSTGYDNTELDRRQLDELGHGLQALLLFVLAVAAASLVIGVAGSLVDRRRPFAYLRATGVQLSELRRTVILETTVPLVATTGLGILIGLAASAAMAASTGQRWVGPGPDFGLTLGSGLVLVVAITSLTLPLVGRITTIDGVRFE